MTGDQRVVAVIQARMGSTRLPGKVLRRLGGRSVLAWVIRAARAAHGIDEVVVATSTAPGDDPILDEARRLRCAFVRGSEDDVISRFVLATESTDADAVVRLTADCPLLDPALISQVVALWRQDPTLGYVATTLLRTLPRGLDVELISRSALVHADQSALDHDRVHVTSVLYGEGSKLVRAGVVVAPSAARYRVTLDTDADAQALEALVAVLGNEPPRWQDLVRALETHPEIVALNAGVQQKALEDG